MIALGARRRLTVAVGWVVTAGIVAGGIRVGQAQVAALSAAQEGSPAGKKMEFDVASVRENKSGGRPDSNFPLGPGAMYSPNGGTFKATGLPLWVYIMFAYKMTDHEVASLRKQLPGWALEDQFDIQAKTEKVDASKDEMRLMMQSLLAERFKLAVHTTTEQVSVYGMVLAKPGKLGPKLRPHPADDTSCSNAPPGAPERGSTPAARPPQTIEGGFPVTCGGAAGLPPSVPGRIAVGYRNVALSLIAVQMTGFGGLDRPVVDQTGLTGNFDFVLEYTPDVPAGSNSNFHPDETGPSFQQALLEQTGLKLVSQKSAVEVIVVDHVEHPSEN